MNHVVEKLWDYLNIRNNKPFSLSRITSIRPPFRSVCVCQFFNVCITRSQLPLQALNKMNETFYVRTMNNHQLNILKISIRSPGNTHFLFNFIVISVVIRPETLILLSFGVCLYVLLFFISYWHYASRSAIILIILHSNVKQRFQSIYIHLDNFESKWNEVLFVCATNITTDILLHFISHRSHHHCRRRLSTFGFEWCNPVCPDDGRWQ